MDVGCKVTEVSSNLSYQESITSNSPAYSVIASKIDHTQRLANRRFLNNADAWSPVQTINSHEKSRKRTLSHRAKNLRGKNGHESNFSHDTTTNIVRKLHVQEINESLGNKIIRLYETAKIDFQDFWRRISRTTNLDPYGIITLRPRGESFKTLPIMGSGSDVLFTCFDENNYDFVICKCPSNNKQDEEYIRALSEMFLKVQIFDYELADDDRELGLAHIILRPIKVLNRPYFAVVSLFHENERHVLSWEGTAEIKCYLTKVTKTDLEKIVETEHIRNFRSLSLIGKKTYLINHKSSLLDVRQKARSVTNLLERIEQKNPPRIEVNQQSSVINNSSKYAEQQNHPLLSSNQVSNSPTASIVLGELQFYETVRVSKVGNNFDEIKILTDKKTLHKNAQRKLHKKRIESKKNMMEFHQKTFKEHILNLVLFASLILSGTLYYGWLNLYEVEIRRTLHYGTSYDENYSTLDALHFSIVTATTVGYGDIYPHTTGGKLFGSAFIVFGVSLFARVIGSIFGYIQAAFEHKQKERMFSRAMSSVENLREFDEDGDGKIDKYEFLKTMLIKRGDVDPKVIENIMHMFDKYDADGSGFIETNEIRDVIKHDYDERMANIVSNDKKLISFRKRNVDQCVFPERDLDIADVINQYIKEEKKEQCQMDEDDNIEDMFYVLNVELIGCSNLPVLDEKAEKTSENFWQFLFALILVVIYLCVGALIFSYVEDADFGSMLWFLVVTSCTVGYGDISPQTSAGKYLNSLFIICNLLLFGYLFTQIFDYIYAREEAIAAEAKRGLQQKNLNHLAKKQFKSLKPYLDERMNCEANIFTDIFTCNTKKDIAAAEKDNFVVICDKSDNIKENNGGMQLSEAHWMTAMDIMGGLDDSDTIADSRM